LVASYKVSFFKNLLSSDGHQFKCLQGAIEIRARSVDHAVQVAQHRFARLHRMPHWMLHADDLEVEMDGKTIAYQVNVLKPSTRGMPPSRAARTIECNRRRRRNSQRI
jgi:hypothetical protein